MSAAQPQQPAAQPQQPVAQPQQPDSQPQQPVAQPQQPVAQPQQPAAQLQQPAAQPQQPAVQPQQPVAQPQQPVAQPQQPVVQPQQPDAQPNQPPAVDASKRPITDDKVDAPSSQRPKNDAGNGGVGVVQGGGGVVGAGFMLQNHPPNFLPPPPPPPPPPPQNYNYFANNMNNNQFMNQNFLPPGNNNRCPNEINAAASFLMIAGQHQPFIQNGPPPFPNQRTFPMQPTSNVPIIPINRNAQPKQKTQSDEHNAIMTFLKKQFPRNFKRSQCVEDISLEKSDFSDSHIQRKCKLIAEIANVICGGNQHLKEAVFTTLKDRVKGTSEDEGLNKMIVDSLVDFITTAQHEKSSIPLFNHLYELPRDAQTRLRLPKYRRSGEYVQTARKAKSDEKFKAVFKFLHGDSGTTLHTTRAPVKVKSLTEKGVAEHHPARIWKHETKKGMYKAFLESEEYAVYQRENVDQKISESYFKTKMCPCGKPPPTNGTKR